MLLLHLHLVTLQMLLSKAAYNWERHKWLTLKKQTDRGTPSLRQCSNKYKLPREEEKEKIMIFFFEV